MAGKTQMILITDDDREYRENLAEILVREGFGVATAGSGEEALARLREQRFQVLLLDMVMPGLDGITLISRIREGDKAIKIILITAFASVDSAVDAIKRGADDYLGKPFRMDELITTIRRVLEEARFEMDVKNLNLDATLSSLANPIRRQSIQLIGSGEAVRLMEIAGHLGVADHTKVLFHLKKLKEGDLVIQNADKSYALTRKGRLTLDFMGLLSRHIPVFS
ncbi:MAG: response regulator [Magnetococcales bacterium]|nr:response regulator [Magnetococcales bacterium]